jgi:hypothetical protein
MRTLPFALAAVMAVGAGNVFAQHFTAPSQLGYSPYGQFSPAMARFQEPAPKPLPMEQADTPAPAPVPGSVLNGGPYGAPNGACGCDSCMSDGWAGCGGGCGCCGDFCCCCRPSWYVTAAGLFMTRDCPDEVEIAFDPLNIDREYLGTQMVCPDDWQEGFEIRVGGYFGCNCRAEVVYWTLDPDNAYASVAGPVDSSLDFNRLDFGILGGVNDWFDGSQYQQISMRSEFHNIEANLWSDYCVCGCCSPLQISLLGGFRFFRFNESFEYFSADQAPALGLNPGADAYYNVKVENNLAGFQLGARAEYRLGCSLGLYAEPRFGIFYNHIEQEQNLVNGNGVVAVDLAGRPFQIASDKEDFATIGQLDVGVSYQVGCSLTGYLGYRLVAASGVALSTDQIPQYMSDLVGIENIDSNGHLFLHGVQGGVTWRF